MTKKLIILGSGGHAHVLIDCLRALGKTPLGIIDPNKQRGESSLFGLPVLGGDEAVFDYSPDETMLINGIGAMPGTNLRQTLYQRFSEAGFSFVTVVHPNAYVAEDAVLAEGVQVMAGAVIQAGSQLGNDCIVNTGACIDHDCRIAAHGHISPGATLCGNVQLGEHVHIGSGAVIIQGLNIGANSVIGAGAIVTKTIGADMMVYPARSLITTRKRQAS
ncbi:MAG: acetyltransferase [Halopseudomonas sp.]